jgi:glycosyltransferase involved in cell wall biosynthesis
LPKILRIVNRFNLGGPAYSIAYLTKYLDPRFEIMLIGGQKDDFEESSEFILQELGVEYTVLGAMRREINLKHDLRSYRELKKIISEFKPDIVHTHAAKAGAIGRLAAHKMKVPVIVHTFHGHVFHSYFGKLKTGFYKALERYLAKKSTGIITLSAMQHHEICNIHKICPNEKALIVPLGIDLNRFQENQNMKRIQFRQEWNIEEETIAIGIVGRIVPIKNHSFFLKGLSKVKDLTRKKVTGVIIGDGDLTNAVKLEAKELGLTISTATENVPNADVVFTSWIKSIDVANAGLDIMCLTSLNEGTPVSLIEAQASSLPVITTDVGGVKDIILDGKSGMLVNRNDFDKYVAFLLELTESKNQREIMGAAGKEFVFANFHYDRFCKKMENIYSQLLDSVNIEKND